MTNKPMLSVERDLIQRIADHCKFWTDHPYLEAIADVEVELRALLDKPTQSDYLDSCAAAASVFAKPAAQHQGEPVSGKCDQDVFDNGHSVCLVDIPKDRAEVICQSISSVTGHKIDWHYIGGRVHIKALLAEQPAPVAVVMPEYLDTKQMDGYQSPYDNGWNACLAAVARLNGVKP